MFSTTCAITLLTIGTPYRHTFPSPTATNEPQMKSGKTR